MSSIKQHKKRKISESTHAGHTDDVESESVPVARQDGSVKSAPVARQDGSAKKIKKGPNAPLNSGQNIEDTEAETGAQLKKGNQDAEKKSRYIIYVTNIPYDATKEDIEKHFGSLKEKIVSIRMLTDKGTGQFRGTCFLECKDKESFSVALKLHHTKILGRKIVVEPTVGGGGKGQNRMQKLNHKKQKFDQVRKKRMERDKLKRKKGGSNNNNKSEPTRA